MKKTWFTAVLIGLLFSACNLNYQLTLDATKLSPPARTISKILFVEKSTRLTTEFINSLRKDLMKTTVRQPIGQQFFYVRILDSDENSSKRFEDAILKNQPDALMFVECVEEKPCRKSFFGLGRMGPLRNSICKTKVNAVLKDAKTEEKLWEGQFFLSNGWGVDVISDKMAEMFLKKLKEDGVILSK